MRALAIVLLLSVPLFGQAQPRIGVLAYGQATEATRRGLLEGLREQGYVEGRNLLIEWRGAGGSPARAKALAEELVRLEVRLIVAMATPAVQAAKNATTGIPIVMAPAGDPMRFVASLSRPGGNVTGVAGFGGDLAGKRIELFREMVPGIRRIGLLTHSPDPFSKVFVRETNPAAAKAGIELIVADVKAPGDVDAAYASLKAAGAEGVIVQGILTGTSWRAAELALKHRLPALSFFGGTFANQGGLVYYSQSTTEVHQRAASFVKRILEGADPAGLPVERPTRTELVINLKTARSLGLAIPASLLLRADQVIE